MPRERAAPEMGLSQQVSVMHRFIEEELARHEAITPQRDDRATALPLLNALFLAVLSEHAGRAPLLR